MKKSLKTALIGVLLVLCVPITMAASYNTNTNWFDTKNVNHLNTIGANIIKANKMPTTVTFKVTDNENMNSEMTYTETVYIFSEDLKYVENDNELAAIVAHEIGHLVNGHAAKSSILNNAIASINPNTTTEKGATTVTLLKTISSNKVSKENDKEADITAVDLLMAANYNPLALISVVYRGEFQAQGGGLLDSNLSYEDRIMNIYDYANYNYPEKVKANYKTDAYQSALNLIYANLKIRNASKSKLAKAEKQQIKLQKAKLKRMKNMAKSTNPWSSAYVLMQTQETK